MHFIHPLKERIVREVGYGLSLEGGSAGDLVKTLQVRSEPVAQRGKHRMNSVETSPSAPEEFDLLILGGGTGSTTAA